MILSLSLFEGCYYDVEEELYGDISECNLDSVSFSLDVIPILDRFCYECHLNVNQLGGVSLEGYSNVITYVENEALLGSIRHDAGYEAMPDNAPKLEPCKIETLELWVANGAPDN